MFLSLLFGIGPLLLLVALAVFVSRRSPARMGVLPAVIGLLCGGFTAWWALAMPSFADDSAWELVVPAIAVAVAVAASRRTADGIVTAAWVAAVFCLAFIAWGLASGPGTGIENVALVLFWALILVPGLLLGLAGQRVLAVVLRD